MIRGKTRDTSLDVAKGFGIACVVAGHCGASLLGINVYGFHMPLFFFISGYLFSVKPIRRFVVGKLKALILPLYIYVLVYALVYWVALRCGLFPGEAPSWLHAILFDPFLSCHAIPFISPMWFLSALFFSNVLFNCYLVIFGDRPKVHIVLGVALILAFIHYPDGNNLGVYGARTAIAFGWLCLGSAFRRIEGALSEKVWLVSAATAYCLCAVFAVSSGFAMVWNEYRGAVASPLVFGAAGSVITVILARRIHGKAGDVMASFGRESLHIMANHLFAMFALGLVFSALLRDRSWFENIYSIPREGVAFIFLAVGLLGPWLAATKARSRIAAVKTALAAQAGAIRAKIRQRFRG